MWQKDLQETTEITSDFGLGLIREIVFKAIEGGVGYFNKDIRFNGFAGFVQLAGPLAG